MEDELRVVAETASGHRRVRSILELEMAIVDLPILLELEHAIRAPGERLDLRRPGVPYGRTGVAEQR